MKLCGALRATNVLHHYEHGDPAPVWHRFYGEDGPVERDKAITIYVGCEREEGHTGKHLARGVGEWTDEQ